MTELERINNDPECYKPLKEWYRSELERLNITEKDIASKYTEATGKKPHMLKHYFKDYQFEIPTKKIWESVYLPLGFAAPYGELKNSYNKVLIFKLCKCIFPKELTILKIQSKKATLKSDLAQTVKYYDEGQRRINRCFSFIGYP